MKATGWCTEWGPSIADGRATWYACPSVLCRDVGDCERNEPCATRNAQRVSVHAKGSGVTRTSERRWTRCSLSNVRAGRGFRHTSAGSAKAGTSVISDGGK